MISDATKQMSGGTWMTRLRRAARIWAMWRPARRAPELDHLSEHMLRDIGMPEDRRYAMLANREAAQARLRAQATGGPFFVPPA
jgi:uncharacterized protein YjiS (DUF1127 family)